MSFDTETGRDRYFAARSRELEVLLDPATGLVAEAYARTVDCPLCGSNRYTTIFVKQGFTFVRCSVCRLVYSNPQVDESVVTEEYRAGGSNDIWVDVLTSPRQLELDRVKFAEILERLELFRGGARLLDVGCSIGLFLQLARERGWQGTGIEFGGRARAYARDELGLDVVDVPLERANFPDASFDVVALLSVLEHLNEPRAMLAEARRVLRPGGALYVVTPNVESFACRVLHERAATFDGRNHLVYFSAETLSDILAREGFEPLEVSTRVSSLRPVLEWLAFAEPYSDADLDADPVVEHLGAALEPLFDALRLGYKLHCLARRVG